MTRNRFIVALFLSAVALGIEANSAHAQRVGRGYPIPLGYRSPSVVFGIGYSPRDIYPTYGTYPYATPRYYVEPTYPLNQVAPVPEATAQNAAAQIRVLVPDANAKVWFDGELTKSTGSERLYHTSPLAPGGNYSYRIRAAWFEKGQEMIQEQVVAVTPGRTSVADFTRPVTDGQPKLPR